MKINETFAGIPEKYGKVEQAKIVLIPVPYTGEKLIHKGPDAFLQAAAKMELYDIETDFEPYKEGIFLAEAIKENSSTEIVLEIIHQEVKKYINRNKFVTIFSGENIISTGTIAGFNECFDNISILHLDAHANVKKEKNGSKFHNECALHAASQNTNLVQVGVRSISAKEKNTINYDKTFFANEMAVNDYWMDEAIELLIDDVFIVLDLDVIDPSLFPSTNNPVSGGLFYYETLTFLKQVFDTKNVVGFEITGLQPNENEKSSDFLAANLYYKMLSYKFATDEGTELEDDFGDENPFSKLSKFKDEDQDF